MGINTQFFCTQFQGVTSLTNTLMICLAVPELMLVKKTTGVGKTTYTFPGQRLPVCRYFMHLLMRSVQFSHSVVSDSLRPHGLQHARPPCPSPTSLLKLISTESVIPSNHLILCCPLLLLPSVFPSIRVFSSESPLHIRCPKNWSFSFSISPSNEYSGLISFRIDWFDLLAVQETLRSLIQHHSSKASVLQRSVFFMVQPSHPYVTTRKTIAVTLWTFVGKVVSLLFNMLSLS